MRCLAWVYSCLGSAVVGDARSTAIFGGNAAGKQRTRMGPRRPNIEVPTSTFAQGHGSFDLTNARSGVPPILQLHGVCADGVKLTYCVL